MFFKYFLVLTATISHIPWVTSESCAALNGAVNRFLHEENLTQYRISYLKQKFNVNGCSCEDKCLRKCCATGYSFSENKRMCVLDQDNSYHLQQYEVLLNAKQKINYILGIECDNYYFLDPFENENDHFSIFENGSMHLVPHDIFVDPNEYCLEYFENKGVCGIVCFPSQNEAEVTSTLKSLGMIISMPFLLATFLVYALLPDRNLPAKALMCYVLSLLFAYILLVTIQLNAGHKATTCISLAFFCYYFFMASFFWMNSSCLDIFFTFSGIRGLLGDKKKEHKRFAYYSAYAWGVPLLMVGFASIFTFAYTDANNSFYTGLGQGQCWFRNGWATGIYFYFPIAILLIVNMVLFGVTTYKIKRVQKDTKMLKNVDSRKHKYDNNDKQRFNLYVKLLFAMGINWSMEVISWAIMWKWSNVPDYVWVLTDFCNAVYGVFIFFIFVFKRNIWMLLKKRYLQLTGRPQQAHNLTSTHRTTMTTSLSSLSKSLERKITPSCLQYNNQTQN